MAWSDREKERGEKLYIVAARVGGLVDLGLSTRSSSIRVDYAELDGLDISMLESRRIHLEPQSKNRNTIDSTSHAEPTSPDRDELESRLHQQNYHRQLRHGTPDTFSTSLGCGVRNCSATQRFQAKHMMPL